MVNKWFTILILVFAAYSFITKPSVEVLTKQEKQETSEYIDKIKNYIDMLTANPNQSTLRDVKEPLLNQNIDLNAVDSSSAQQDSFVKSKPNSPEVGIIQEKIINFTYNILHTKPGKDLLEKVLLSSNLDPSSKQNSKHLSQYTNNSILDVIEGYGESKANCGDLVELHYITRLVDGQEIENTHISKKPIVFQVGDGKVIKGIEYAVIGMKEGGIRRLIVPPKFAYQDKRFSKDMIAGNEFVTIDIELIKIKGASTKIKDNIRIFDEIKEDSMLPMLCGNEVYFTYKIFNADEKLLYKTFNKVHFKLGSSEVPAAINEAFLNIKTNSKRIIIMPSSLIYNQKIKFLPNNISLPSKGMLVLEIYTLGELE